MRDIFSTLSLAKSVLTDARVIGTAIAVFLVMDFAVFVANYTKKPKRKKKRRVEAAPVNQNAEAAPAPESGEAETETA
ncbi:MULTISPECIES: hypothetical protein [unclassified Treponema]|uniref:hypothetical protein n=1 Tax=Treponema TaxID=157 RepID=UPI001651DB7C|nr:MULTISPECIES: hypothetical protein [unclassified Treponema]MBC6720886.1 hypothetical protein [Treponema sp. Marseille-Q4130]MBM7023486.1 hypothetical protein [Treponema sp. Marseille-Q4523]